MINEDYEGVGLDILDLETNDVIEVSEDPIIGPGF